MSIPIFSKRILLVHSTDHMRELLGSFLADMGNCEVIGVSSPFQAYHLAAENKPDAILLDISTQIINVEKFIKKIQKNQETEKIPVILLALPSQVIDQEVLQGLEVHGVLEYQSDPIDFWQRFVYLLNQR